MVSVGFITSSVGELLSLVSVLIDLSQSPDEACPLISLGHADLLQKDGQHIRQKDNNTSNTED